MEAYALSVKISAIDTLSPVLTKISGLFGAAGGQAKEFEARLAKIHQTNQKGNEMLMKGAMMAAAFKLPIEETERYSRAVLKLKQQGLVDTQIEQAKRFVTAHQSMNASMAETMEMFADMQGSFRESGSGSIEAAQRMLQPMMDFVKASSLLSEESKQKALSNVQNASKLIEVRGGLNDPEKVKDMIDAIFKGIQGSGGLVDAKEFRNMMRQGKIATDQLSDKFVYGQLEPIIGALSGFRTGTGLQAASDRLNAISGYNNRPLLNEAVKLGLWDKRAFVLNDQGGVKKRLRNPLNEEMRNLMATDPVGFSERLMEVYAKHGITSKQDVAAENTILFNKTGARVYGLIMDQLEVLKKSGESFDRAIGAQALIKAADNTPISNIQQFQSSLHDLYLEVGTSVLPAFNDLLADLTSFAHSLRDMPGLVKAATYALVGLMATSFFTGGLLKAKAGLELVGAAAGRLTGISDMALDAASAAAQGAGVWAARMEVVKDAGVAWGLRLPFLSTAIEGVAAAGVAAQGALVLAAAGIGVAIGSVVNNLLNATTKLLTGYDTFGEMAYDSLHQSEMKTAARETSAEEVAWIKLMQAQHKNVSSHDLSRLREAREFGGYEWDTFIGETVGWEQYEKKLAAVKTYQAETAKKRAAMPAAKAVTNTEDQATALSIMSPESQKRLTDSLNNFNVAAPKTNEHLDQIKNEVSKLRQDVKELSNRSIILSMDGRTVAQTVTKHQVQAANRPTSGNGSLDHSATLMPVGLSQ